MSHLTESNLNTIKRVAAAHGLTVASPLEGALGVALVLPDRGVVMTVSVGESEGPLVVGVVMDPGHAGTVVLHDPAKVEERGHALLVAATIQRQLVAQLR